MKRNHGLLLVKALLDETNNKEKNQLNQLLANDVTTANQLHEWQQTAALLQKYTPGFQSNFRANVLRNIGRMQMLQKKQKEIYVWMLRTSIAAAAAVFLLLLYVIWQENSLSIESVLGLKGLLSEDFTNLLATY